ncbi:MAG: hypothetical protein HY033_11520 [Ignavibacteriae bacterium]|nr:hypothetical protein [Ignavibacteria bacterium]MBI3365526.1 hypothetical protein [Ignavibacteriota bacterium]
MKIVASIMVCTLLVLGTVSGQVTVLPEQHKHIDRSIFGLGLSAGVASGFGISFRHHLPGDFSYQLVGGIIKTDRKTHATIGGEMQVDFVRGESVRFFGDGAVGYFFSGEQGNNDLDAPLRFGLGVGAEWRSGELFHLTGELLFTYFSDGTILPLPQVSAHYYFF